jgi:diadenosine tetraphosphate (Ap4A) HIT family hydrolase
MQRGEGCPLCAPRADQTPDRRLISSLGCSSLYLNGNQAWRGWCQLIYDSRHVVSLDELSPAEYSLMAEDLYRATQAVRRACDAPHINVASLGNSIPHLHWHIIPRSPDQPRWGWPVWTSPGEEMPTLALSDAEAGELTALIAALL